MTINVVLLMDFSTPNSIQSYELQRDYNEQLYPARKLQFSSHTTNLRKRLALLGGHRICQQPNPEFIQKIPVDWQSLPVRSHTGA